MEPVTHVLTGACLARTGLNRRAAYATVAMAIAAEFPDIDTLWGLRGPVSSFEHHRGITHTFLGIPFEAAFLVLLFFLIHKRRSRPARASGGAPVRWGLLYLFVLIASLSHLLLDFTNNYGLRPFFPFIPRWYAASIVFIFDPLLFLLLVAGLTLPALFGSIGQAVGAKREPFGGRGWASAALLCILLLWGVRWWQHDRALTLAQSQSLRAPGNTPSPTQEIDSTLTANLPTDQPAPDVPRPLLPAQRSLASPDPLSIFRWYTATDFGSAYRLGVADSRLGTLDPGQVLTKPQPTPTLTAAEQSRLGRIYLDWSPMPFLSTDQIPSADNALSAYTPQSPIRVRFTDPRFIGGTTLLHQSGQAPLTGEVLLAPDGHVLAEGIGGHFGR